MNAPSSNPVERPPNWCRWVLLAAAVYNLAWGTWVILFPNALFTWLHMPAPRYPEIWQCVGMIVGVYGIGYALAARRPEVHWPIVFVGLLGKIFGPLGFVIGLGRGNFPWQWGWMLITNDLIWWIPFTAILYQAFRYHAAPRSSPRLPEDALSSHPRSKAREGESVASRPDVLQECLTSGGESLELLSNQAPCLIVFLRHFGCSFSREAVTQLALNRGAFERRGIALVVVHMSSPTDGEAFLRQYGLDGIRHVSDPTCALYRAFGLRRGTWRQLFGLRVWWRGFQVAILQRHGVGRMDGDGFQLSGAFLLDGGTVVDAYRSQLASDLPDLLQFACQAPTCGRPNAGTAAGAANS